MLKSHDIIDNIERDFHDNDNIHLVIHYDPIVTGDEAVLSMREWVKEKVVGISPELSIHDFRMVQGPSHTNLIFDVLAPQGFALSDMQLQEEIQKRVTQENKQYYTVVTVDHSFAPYHQD